MPIKNGKHATRKDVIEAIQEHHPFSADPTMRFDIVLPTAYADRAYLGRHNRAYITNADNGAILVTAPSTYELVEKIRNGWKYKFPYQEGLMA
jgi:hypothetical protein